MKLPAAEKRPGKDLVFSDGCSLTGVVCATYLIQKSLLVGGMDLKKLSWIEEENAFSMSAEMFDTINRLATTNRDIYPAGGGKIDLMGQRIDRIQIVEGERALLMKQSRSCEQDSSEFNEALEKHCKNIDALFTDGSSMVLDIKASPAALSMFVNMGVTRGESTMGSDELLPRLASQPDGNNRSMTATERLFDSSKTVGSKDRGLIGTAVGETEGLDLHYHGFVIYPYTRYSGEGKANLRPLIPLVGVDDSLEGNPKAKGITLEEVKDLWFIVTGCKFDEVYGGLGSNLESETEDQVAMELFGCVLSQLSGILEMGGSRLNHVKGYFWRLWHAVFGDLPLPKEFRSLTWDNFEYIMRLLQGAATSVRLITADGTGRTLASGYAAVGRRPETMRRDLVEVNGCRLDTTLLPPYKKPTIMAPCKIFNARVTAGSPLPHELLKCLQEVSAVVQKKYDVTSPQGIKDFLYRYALEATDHANRDKFLPPDYRIVHKTPAEIGSMKDHYTQWAKELSMQALKKLEEGAGNNTHVSKLLESNSPKEINHDELAAKAELFQYGNTSLLDGTSWMLYVMCQSFYYIPSKDVAWLFPKKKQRASIFPRTNLP